MTSRWLTPNDVAGTLGFTAKTVRAWCARGVFPGARKYPDNAPRSEWRIPATDVEAMKRDRTTSTPVPRDRLDQLMDQALARAS